MQGHATAQQRDNADFPIAQRTNKRHQSLQDHLQQFDNRADGLAAAYRDGALTMTAMAKALDMSLPTICRWIAQSEKKGG
jgi:hypothetical protein